MRNSESKKLIQATAADVLMAQLTARAVEASLEAIHTGGYPFPLTEEQSARLTHRIVEEARIGAVVLIDDATVTDAQLDEAAEITGRAAVVEVLGPAPAAN